MTVGLLSNNHNTQVTKVDHFLCLILHVWNKDRKGSKRLRCHFLFALIRVGYFKYCVFTTSQSVTKRHFTTEYEYRIDMIAEFAALLYHTINTSPISNYGVAVQ